MRVSLSLIALETGSAGGSDRDTSAACVQVI